MSLAAYPTYGSYKDSGVEWIGDVPSEWQVEPGRQCVYENREKNTRMKQNTVLSLSYGRVIVKDEDKLTGLVPESFETYQIVQPGDIIIRGTDLQNDMTSLRTGLAKDVGIITSAYINLRPKAQINQVFLHYLLHSYDVKKVFYALGSGLRQNLSYLDFKYLKLPIPSPDEQRAIAEFLDGKCAGVEEAVRIKEAQIALLRERRQILIQHAVTRGLNPAAPMKDSGIDWIGQIPAHWEVKRFTKEIEVQEGPGIMAVDFHDSGVPLIRISGVRGRQVTLEGCNFLSTAKVRRKWDHFKLSEGDLVISGSASTGFVSEVGPEAAGAILYTGLIKLKIKRASIEKRYLEHFLSSDLFNVQVELLKAGSTIAHYGPSHLGRMFVVLPPVDEQPEISVYCDGLNARVGEAISIKQDQIAALKEYKASLINAAVTGKIKVV
ncbi:restriction endonuclease subunit S [Roseovarius sp. M141]|uniref:restriction endonuclease subunit S n=1 Tax=Roseovarius sp. M141 TaxID=2583806 RepID=UPI0020CDFE87|nr:restriction endonuclease subunit S [Roseovarius sp. M141]MCQ0090928.1 restriction endonuclease subunit S [Roseovarius sp. M141]